MTKIAVIADIHSNVLALDAVCNRIDELGCNVVFCLGDIVGYGVDPAPCIKKVQQLNMVCVQGNHDAHVSDDGSGGEYGFNYAAVMAVLHNREHLNEAEISFLRELPTSLEWDKGVLLAHGSPQDRDKYLRFDADLRETSMDLLDTDGPGVLFFGHTHQPMVHDGQSPMRDADGVYFLNPDRRTIINPGSVGQPRDGDPRAAFMVWDDEEGTVTQHRVAYDFEQVRSDIIAAGLPHQLGDRLLRGK